MTNSYALSAQMVSKTLTSLITILQKAEAWATETGMSQEDLLNAKLAPDMFPLLRQIQICSDSAKGMSGRFAGLQAPVMEDSETTIEELIQRLQKTIDFIASIPVDNYDKTDKLQIVLPYLKGKYQTAQDYLINFAIPNFYFHVSVAYCILRNLGLNIGKMDYIGSLNLHELE